MSSPRARALAMELHQSRTLGTRHHAARGVGTALPGKATAGAACGTDTSEAAVSKARQRFICYGAASEHLLCRYNINVTISREGLSRPGMPHFTDFTNLFCIGSIKIVIYFESCVGAICLTVQVDPMMHL